MGIDVNVRPERSAIKRGDLERRLQNTFKRPAMVGSPEELALG